MIVFTNTRNEEAVSLSLNNFQLSAQTYKNSPAFIQLYLDKNYKTALEAKLPRIFSLIQKNGPRDVVVSIGACGDLLEKGRSKRGDSLREPLIDKGTQIALWLGSNPDEGPSYETRDTRQGTWDISPESRIPNPVSNRMEQK